MKEEQLAFACIIYARKLYQIEAGLNNNFGAVYNICHNDISGIMSQIGDFLGASNGESLKRVEDTKEKSIYYPSQSTPIMSFDLSNSDKIQKIDNSKSIEFEENQSKKTINSIAINLRSKMLQVTKEIAHRQYNFNSKSMNNDLSAGKKHNLTRNSQI